MEQKVEFRESPDPFIAEIHTGKRVLENVAEILSRDQAQYSDIKEAHLERADQNKESWQEIIAQLPQKEREAFEVALARGLEDFYYTHYNAVRAMTESVNT